MNLDNTLADLEHEATLVNDAIIAIQRLREHKQGKAKPRRKAIAKPRRKARTMGILETVVTIVKKRPGMTSADILERVKNKQERKSTYNAIYSATSRGVLKKDAKGGLTYVGE